MTHGQRIEMHLTDRPGLCDDCLTRELGISRRQNVRSICTRSGRISGRIGPCIGCGKNKIIRSLETNSADAHSKSKRTPKSPIKRPSYLREHHLRDSFNKSIAATLRIAPEDYYGRLSFAEMLGLKAGYARIHDIITLKLTFALVDCIGQRLKLSLRDSQRMIAAVDAIHPNASGFDLDSQEPNVIGEVKGCIPVNGGRSFGAAQTRGLTSDALQMLGSPALGKQADKLSQNAKIHRSNRAEALKFLGLYESPEVRTATESWRRNLLRSESWTLGSSAIQNLPETGELLTDVVYLVYLTPPHPDGSGDKTVL